MPAGPLWTCACKVKNLGTAGFCHSCGQPRPGGAPARSAPAGPGAPPPGGTPPASRPQPGGASPLGAPSPAGPRPGAGPTASVPTGGVPAGRPPAGDPARASAPPAPPRPTAGPPRPVAAPPHQAAPGAAPARAAAGPLPPPPPFPPAATPVSPVPPGTTPPNPRPGGAGADPYAPPRPYAAPVSIPARPARSGISSRTAFLAVGIITVQAVVMVALVLHFTGGQKAPAPQARQPVNVPANPQTFAPGSVPSAQAAPGFPVAAAPAATHPGPVSAAGYPPPATAAPAAGYPQPAAPPAGTYPPAADPTVPPVPDSAQSEMPPAVSLGPGEARPTSPAGWDSSSAPTQAFGRSTAAEGNRPRRRMVPPPGWNSGYDLRSAPGAPSPTQRSVPTPSAPPVTATAPAYRAYAATIPRYLEWFERTERERQRLEVSFQSSYTTLVGAGTANEADALTTVGQPLGLLCKQHSDAKDAFWRNARATRPAIPAECQPLNTLYSQAWARDQRASRALYRSVNNLDANSFRTALEERREVQADFASAVTMLQQVRAR